MAAAPRLNGLIRVLEEGKTPIATFVSPPLYSDRDHFELQLGETASPNHSSL